MSGAKAKPSKLPQRPEGRKRHRVIIEWVISFVLGAATTLGGVAVLMPRPVVIQGDPVDPSNPFSASFTITNTNFIQLNNVTAYVVFREMANEPAVFKPIYHPHMGGPESETYLFRPEWKGHTLGMDERFTITPADLITCCGSSPSAGAEFGVAVEYSTWIYPFTRRKIFAFATHKQSNGQLYWYSIPNN